MSRRKRQATRQAEWRDQLRSTSNTLLWLVALLVIGGMYLAVNAKLARAGRAVLQLEDRREELRRTNSQLAATYAELTAPERLAERAAALGFRPAMPGEIEFVVVEGFIPRPEFEAPKPPALPSKVADRLSPAYSETLGEWITRWLGGG